MGRPKKSERDTTENVVVNINLKLNDPDEKISSIARLLRDGDYVDEKRLVHLKGKDLTMYLLAARVKELQEGQNQPQEKVPVQNVSVSNENKLKSFGIKSNSLS